MLYVPLREELPEVEKNLEKKDKNDFSLLYAGDTKNRDPKAIESYPLETMFEVYKDSIPNYIYKEFHLIVEEQLTSARSDDEIVAYLLDTFGCSVFDFITEIVRNRHKRINYGSTLGEACLFFFIIFYKNG